MEFDNIILLQPTSPNRSVKFFNEILKKYLKQKYQSLITVKPSIDNPEIMVNMKTTSKWNFLVKYNFQKGGRQYYKKFFKLDGNFYIFSNKFFRKNNSFFKENVTHIEINYEKNNIDIDTKMDLNN